MGHEVWGVDIDPAKVNSIKHGQSPILEKGLQEIVTQYSEMGQLHATTSVATSIANTDISLICVGTPSEENGSLNTRFVQRVASDIGSELKKVSHPHMIVIRSTLLPGTTIREVLPRLEGLSGKSEGNDFFLAYNPEFLREGSAVSDFFNPPKIIVGANRRETAERAAEIYKNISAPLFITRIDEAEMVKYADNIFHALKVIFSNEIGAFAKLCALDSHRIMDIFISDTKLNLSPAYLKPGFAFGGSCLPKDIRALISRAQELNIKLPMLSSIIDANREHVQRVIKTIIGFGKKKVGMLGLAFKSGTDDLRESPMVELVETLLGKGFCLKIYDKNVSLSRLTGANRKFIEEAIPHIAGLLCETMDQVVDHADVVVIANKDEDFIPVLKKIRPGQIVLDLVRITPDVPREMTNYHGVCW
jgi:GDP-mannose 6-dehydrogenase